MARGLSVIAVALPLLALPSASRADDVPADAVIAAIPFHSPPRPNKVDLDIARIGNQSFVVELDTGATDSYFTPGAARAHGVSARRDQDRPYRHATRLGRDLQFWVDERRTDTASSTGYEYGLVGGPFLRDYVVEIDYGGRVVRFIDPKKFPVQSPHAEDENVVPLRIVANRPFVEVRIAGRPIQVLLDTGDPFPVSLSGAAVQQMGIDVGSLPEIGAADALSPEGPISARVYEAPDFELGKFHFARTPLVVQPRGAYNAAGTTDSTIGHDVLSRFVVRLDYPHQKLWLLRRSDAVPFLSVDLAGVREARDAGLMLSYAPPRTWEVESVKGDSPAGRLGIKPGDKLLGESTQDGRALSLEDVLAALKSSQHVRVARKLNEAWVDLDLPDDPMLQTPAP